MGSVGAPPVDWEAWFTWLGGLVKSGIGLFGEVWSAYVVPLVGVVPALWVGVGLVVLVGLRLALKR